MHTFLFIEKLFIHVSLQEEGILITEYLSLHGGDCISKYVANIDGLTSRELFAGCSLNEADGRENKINEVCYT